MIDVYLILAWSSLPYQVNFIIIYLIEPKS